MTDQIRDFLQEHGARDEGKPEGAVLTSYVVTCEWALPEGGKALTFDYDDDTTPSWMRYGMAGEALMREHSIDLIYRANQMSAALAGDDEDEDDE